LKYRNIAFTRGARCPATLRSVWVNADEPVACSTVRPCRDSSPSSDSAMTLLPEPGPPTTTIACLVTPRRARSSARSTRRYAVCC
jgi:hypothetical protein